MIGKSLYDKLKRQGDLRIDKKEKIMIEIMENFSLQRTTQCVAAFHSEHG